MTAATLPTLPGFAEHFGIPVSFIGDNGDWIVGLGHHDTRRFIAAVGRHVRRDLGWRSLSFEWNQPTYADVAADTAQSWCVLAKACRDHGDAPDLDCAYCSEITQADWWLRWDVGQDTPGAFPVTVLAAH